MAKAKKAEAPAAADAGKQEMIYILNIFFLNFSFYNERCFDTMLGPRY